MNVQVYSMERFSNARRSSPSISCNDFPAIPCKSSYIPTVAPSSFGRVAVLGDEVAGEAGEMVVLNDLYRALAARDRFADAGKVIVLPVSRLLTRGYGALDGLLEASPLAITQQHLQIAGAPVLGAVLVGLFYRLERLVAEGRQLCVAHLAIPIFVPVPGKRLSAPFPTKERIWVMAMAFNCARRSGAAKP